MVVSRDSVDEYEDEQRSRLNRFGWEGTFFLLVLLAGMAVLWRALRRSAELRRRQENFLAAVTHELKSPIASIRLAAETLELRDPPAEKRVELVGRMLGALDRLESTVVKVLDTASVEEGARRAAPERIDLAEEVRGLIAVLERRAEEGRVRLAYEADDATGVHADRAAVRSVLQNLVDNAIQSSAAAGGGRVDLRLERDGASVRVTVTDDGVGFPPEEAERLFEKFYRTGDELRRRSKGSGLGLYLVKRLVEAGGGSVRAESAGPGQGATFTVSWPAARSSASAPERGSAA